MIIDFSFVLVALAALTGALWALDHFVFLPRRAEGAREPVLAEYARSFFPIILIVLVVRSFLFEPFRIPSDSMMPTLVDGDFIFVSKFAYGLRLPVANTLVVPIGQPARGDVIVFRKPSEPSVNLIKRLVGLPGDRVQVRGDAIWINGQPMTVGAGHIFRDDDCYLNFREAQETLGEHVHSMMYCPARTERMRAGCTEKRDLNECVADPAEPGAAAGPTIDYETRVPADHYFFMGDNRDNSADSRFPDVGFVPADHLVGKAVRVWLSWAGGKPAWKRIGKAIR